jgi:hypothetical protein
MLCAASIAFAQDVSPAKSAYRGKSVLSRNAIAVVIGNKTYKNPKIPTVDYALNDAGSFRDTLVGVFGIDPKSVTYLENASQADMNSQFGTASDYKGAKVFRAAMLRDSPADLILYYSGHGAPAISGAEKGKGYLVPVDADVSSIQATGYAIDTLLANIEQWRKNKAINRCWIVFDACFSGQSGQGKPLIEGVSGLSIVPTAPKAADKGSVMMFASAGDEYASWYPDQKHGLFTHILLQGLAGYADSDENGEVGIGELDVYLRREVPRLAFGLNGQEQTPQVVSGGEIEGFLTLGRKEGEFQLAIPTGWIELKALPAGAQVELNGKPAVLEAEGDRTQRLRPGDHKIKVSAPYMRDYAETVTIAAGEGTPFQYKGLPIGILALKGSPSGILLEVCSESGIVAKPAAPLQYELTGGAYIVRAKPADDIDWSWQEKVVMIAGSTLQLPIPAGAYDRSIAWTIREEKARVVELERKYDEGKAKKAKAKPYTIGGFAGGGALAVAAGLFYFLGASAMQSYDAATTVAEVEDWRSKVDLYNALLLGSASGSAIGLGLGGFMLATTPDPAKIEAQVQESLDRIKKLEARRLVVGIE